MDRPREGSGDGSRAIPAWRDWRLRDIDRLAIQQWVAEKCRQQCGWQTVRNAWVLLSGILETAVEYGYLSVNAARSVKFPQQALKEKPSIIAGDSFAKLLKHVDEPHRTMVSLITAMGLRIGELLGLKWRALDLDVGTLAVRESVFEGQFQPPKTQKAVRTIPLGPHAIAALTASTAHQSAGARGSRVWESEGRSLARVQAAEERAATGGGGGGLGTSDLASVPPHSFVASERSEGAVKFAQEQLGHASISTTLNIYTHVVDASHRTAVEAVGSRLFGDHSSLPMDEVRRIAELGCVFTLRAEEPKRRRRPDLDRGRRFYDAPSSCSNSAANEGRPMRYACIVAALMSAPMVETKGLQGAKSSTPAYAPYVLYWPQKPGDPRPRHSVGLLYTPELLAALIARHSPETVPARVSEAVQQQTPIVVMWTIPPIADVEPLARPFSAAIVEDGDSFGGRLRIEPLWTLQNADELRELDTRTPFQEVGVMAAFPRSAFVPGRLVTIYLRLPSEPGQLRGVQRFGLIEWNGALPKARVEAPSRQNKWEGLVNLTDVN